MFRALTQSDNTCNDIVLRHAGGPPAVRAMFARNRLAGIRFGPGERLLQAGIAGMNWNNAFSVGRGFEAARSQVPPTARRQAFERYIADPIDGATPDGSPTASPACSAANCCRAPRPRGCSRSCRRSAPARSGCAAASPRAGGSAAETGSGQILGGRRPGRL